MEDGLVFKKIHRNFLDPLAQEFGVGVLEQDSMVDCLDQHMGVRLAQIEKQKIDLVFRESGELGQAARQLGIGFKPIDFNR